VELVVAQVGVEVGLDEVLSVVGPVHELVGNVLGEL
jgi:hypothetical protein